MTVFERTERPPLLFQQAIQAAREALKKNPDPGALETMDLYFASIRSLKGEKIDSAGVVAAFEKGIKGCGLPFRTVAEKFHLIDRNTYTVYVPYGEGADLVEQLKAGKPSKELFRRLGRYAVSVYDDHFWELEKAGALLTAREVPGLGPDSAILQDLSLYSETVGLSMHPETGLADFI